MDRTAFGYLQQWYASPTRKPLVIRGARQVGKSYLVNSFAKKVFNGIVTIDFEQDPSIATLFIDKNPTSILKKLELRMARSIVPGEHLLFLDEIQAAPDVFASLRYFYEQMPQLHVIAAGSLLEFALEDHAFSMPVGRIEYLYLSPMTFEEYLADINRPLLDFLNGFQLGDSLPEVIHQQCMKLMREYYVLGGMPEVLEVYRKTGSFLECEKSKQAILTTYGDDFSKYKKRVNTKRLHKVYNRLPFAIGKKLSYSQIDREEKSRDLKEAIRMLGLAKVIYRVHHTAANGIPLRSEINDKVIKLLFLDIGLLCQATGLNLLDFDRYDDIMLINTGMLCEQFVGQQLLASASLFKEPELFWWVREKFNANAEIDYVIAQGNRIIPIEVKAGKTGSLKSVHQFLYEKNRDFAVRFNSDVPSMFEGTSTLTSGASIEYKLLSLPLYMVNQLNRLLKDTL